MNLNCTVRVKLTEAGKRRAVEWGKALGLRAGYEMSAGERTGEWQLWRLMQVFGDAMYNGMPEALFENNEILFGGLNELRDMVHGLAVEKGWHEDRDINDPHVLGSMLALIHSEVSEALEEVRVVGSDPMLLRVTNFHADRKLDGFPIELADIIIRVLDMCGALGIDIEQAVTVKHAYNATRSHRHGGKKL